MLDWQSFKLGNLSFEQSKFHEKCKSLFLYNSFTRRKKFSKLKDIIRSEVFHLRKWGILFAESNSTEMLI